MKNLPRTTEGEGLYNYLARFMRDNFVLLEFDNDIDLILRIGETLYNYENNRG